MSLSFEDVRSSLRKHPIRRTALLLAENRQLREAIGVRWPGLTFVGESEAAEMVRRQIAAAATLDHAVLITGEAGVGKSLVARLIHQSSARASNPFVVVKCSAFGPRPLRAELFGVRPGGSEHYGTERLARLELAEGGTLFLDEVGDVPPRLQSQLLSFIRRGTYRRVGEGSRRHGNVRIIAASSSDVRVMARTRRFNRELLAQLQRCAIQVPALRQRWEDIPTLAEAILARRARPAGPTLQLGEEARRALLRHAWPGNVRELEDVLQRAIALAPGSRIEAIEPHPVTSAHTSPDSAVGRIPASRPLRDLERIAILQTLDACHGNRAEAARQLGLSKKGFYLKLRRFGLWDTVPQTRLV